MIGRGAIAHAPRPWRPGPVVPRKGGDTRMARFRIHDLNAIERTPTSPASLRNKLSDMILSSVNARAKVEVINPETGEYRIVLQGTLDKEETKFDEG